MSRQVFIYGLRGANDKYGLAAHFFIKQENWSIENLEIDITHMLWENPDIEYIYMIDSSYELRRVFRELFRAHRDEKLGVEFKLYLEQKGIELPISRFK